MSLSSRCPECGAEVPEGAGLLKLCPRCLLKQAFPVSELDTPQDSGPGLPEQFGVYHSIGVLGEGGMGIVYLAEQESPIRRRVALKVIKQGMDTRQVIARFETERQALAMMDHPNIARVWDAGATTEGRPYFAMEYVPGIPITDYCDKSLLGPRERLELFMQVCHAIHHAHQKGVIHRDIKPSNVLVTIQDGKPVPKVIDFGVAKATNQRLTEKSVFTEIGMLIGTPAYMSPEQAQMTGLDVDTTTDIYSLGVLLYELLVGALPFDAKVLKKAGYDEIRRIIREDEPPRPTTRLNSLGPTATEVARLRRTDVRSLGKFLEGDLDWITMKALEKDRVRRYASASEFAADVLRHLRDEPVEAGPPARLYRARKFVRKNRGPVIAILAVFVSLVVGLAASTILYLRAEQQRIEAQAQRAEADRQRLEAERQQSAAQFERAEAERQGNEAQRQKSLTEQERIQAEQARREAERQAQEAERQANEAKRQAQEADRQRSLADQRGDQARQSSADAQQQRIVAEQQRAAAEQKTREAEEQKANAERLRLREQRQSYLANLTAADSLLRSGEVIEAKRRLSQCPANLRGWEWRYLARKADSSQITIRANGVRGVPVAQMALSRDGSRILWASGEGLYSWKEPNYTPLPEHHGFDRILAFSADGSHIVAASASASDSNLSVYEAASGRKLATFEGHRAKPFSAVFTKDGTRVASLAGDAPVTLWDVATGKVVATLPGRLGRVSSISISDDGRRVVTGGADKTIRLWDASTGQALYSATGHSGAVASLLLDRSRSRIFSGSADGSARIWDAATGRELHALMGHGEAVVALAESPDGVMLASAAGTTLRLWDAASGKQFATLHADWGANVNSLAFSADGSRVLAMSETGELKVWDASTYGQTIFTRSGGPFVAMAQDGKLFTGKSEDALSRQIFGATGLNGASLPGETTQITAFGLSSSGTRMVTASAQILRVWDLKPPRLVSTISLTAPATAVAISADGKRVASGGNRTLQIWDAAGPLLRQWELPAGPAVAIAFSPDGKRVAAGTQDSGQIGVWDSASGQLSATLTGHAAAVLALQFTPDGTRIISGSSDHTLRIWDADTYDPLLVLRDQEESITSLACTPDCARIYSGSSSGTVRMWEAPVARDIK